MNEYHRLHNKYQEKSQELKNDYIRRRTTFNEMKNKRENEQDKGRKSTLRKKTMKGTSNETNTIRTSINAESESQFDDEDETDEEELEKVNLTN